MKGLFYLSSPRDLLAKLRHDMDRLEHDQVNAYAAFDFFVTARHMPEWLYPGERDKQKALFDSSVLLRVCRHIADGSKHFHATAKQHNSVKDTSLTGAAFQRGAFQSKGFQVGRLIIELDGEAAEKLGASIEVRDLARQILALWEEQGDLR